MSLPATGDITELEFGEILEQVIGQVSRAQTLATQVDTQVRSIVSNLPDFATGPIFANLDHLRRLSGEISTKLSRFLAQPGNPAQLQATRDQWINLVGAKASVLVGTSTLDYVQADDHWQGVAADAYKNTLLPQKQALTAIKEAANDIADQLNAMSFAIVGFWVAVISALASFVAALIAAVAATATVVGAPAGAAVAAAAAALAVTWLAATAAGTYVLFDQIGEATTALQQRLVENDAFPQGWWPRSTTDMSDGSLNDGDDTDWHLR